VCFFGEELANAQGKLIQEGKEVERQEGHLRRGSTEGDEERARREKMAATNRSLRLGKKRGCGKQGERGETEDILR